MLGSAAADAGRAGLGWLPFWMPHIWMLVLQCTVTFTDVSACYLLWRN